MVESIASLPLYDYNVTGENDRGILGSLEWRCTTSTTLNVCMSVYFYNVYL